MSSMTHTALSDCSYPDSDNGDVKSQIANVFERLKTVIQEQDNLRQSLKALFDKQESDALEELRRAEKNLEAIREERSRMEIQVSIKSLRNHAESPQPLDPRVDTPAINSPKVAHISFDESVTYNQSEPELTEDDQLTRRLKKDITNLEEERNRLLEDERKYKKEEGYWKMVRSDICDGGEDCQKARGCHCCYIPCQCARYCECGCHTATDDEKETKAAANTKIRALSTLLSNVQSRLRDINGEYDASNRLIAHLLNKEEAVQTADDSPRQESTLGNTITVAGSVGKSKWKKKGKAA